MNNTIKRMASIILLAVTCFEVRGALMTFKNNSSSTIDVSIDVGNREASDKSGNRIYMGSKSATLKAGETKDIDLGGARCATKIIVTTRPNTGQQKTYNRKVDLCKDRYIEFQGNGDIKI